MRSATVVAAPGAAALPDGDRGEGEADDRVDPPPAVAGGEGEAEQDGASNWKRWPPRAT
jgi:hypothetical protein